VDPPVLGRHCLELQTKWTTYVVAIDTATERDEWLQVLSGTVDSAQCIRRDDTELLLEAEVLSDLREILAPPDAHGAISHVSRRRAVQALLQMKPSVRRQGMGLLRELAAADGDAEVRKLAVMGLGMLPEEDAEEVLPTLLNSMLDANADVRFRAAEGLGGFGINVCHISIHGILSTTLISDHDIDFIRRVRRACAPAIAKSGQALVQPVPYLKTMICATPVVPYLKEARSDFAGKCGSTRRSDASVLAAPDSGCDSFAASGFATKSMNIFTDEAQLMEKGTSLNTMPDVEVSPSIFVPPSSAVVVPGLPVALWRPRFRCQRTNQPSCKQRKPVRSTVVLWY
jgi:hypothetical protein